MLNIVLPMAGRGSRFQKVGYTTPKPLIKINNKRMIQGVIDNLTPNMNHRFIFICQKEHIIEYDLKNKLREWAPGCEIITIEHITQGAACTVLLAENFINNDNQLMIANSDQWIGIDINNYLRRILSNTVDGLIMTMKAEDDKWSYVRLDKENKVTEVVEKEVISDEATVGIYNFSRGSLFCQAAKEMIDQRKLVNGEYYVAPSYNEMITKGYKIGIYNIGSLNAGMYGLRDTPRS